VSLQQLKKEELLKLAKKFEVDVTEDNNKKEITEALLEKNITFATWTKFFAEENAPDVEEVVSFEESKILLKMERKNGTFEAFGIVFTKEHPFTIVSEHLAQQIIDNYEGFRIATPSEAKSYYG